MDSFHPFDQNGNHSFSNGFGLTHNVHGKQEHFNDLSSPRFFGASNEDHNNPFYTFQTFSFGKEANDVVCVIINYSPNDTKRLTICVL